MADVTFDMFPHARTYEDEVSVLHWSKVKFRASSDIQCLVNFTEKIFLVASCISKSYLEVVEILA